MNIPFQQYTSERLYPIGFTFTIKRGKQPAREYNVLNYLITHNANGSIVNFRYLVAHDFMGQRLTEELVQTTIDRATNNGWKEL